MVSLYPNIRVSTGGADVALPAVFEGIRSGRWREQVEAVRAIDATTKQGQEERRALKKGLPYFTVSGTFTRRSEAGLKAHSGLVCIDIDHDLSMREELGADPYTYAMFVSTGGDGLAVIVRIPTDNHNASYKALKRYYEETYGITSIDSLPDVSRPRFVSYDPEIFINEESQLFTQQLAEPEHKPAARPQVQYPAPTKPASHGQAALQTAVRKILEAPAGDKHHTRKRMSYLCGGYVATGLLSEHEAQEALEDAVRQTSPAAAWKDAFSTIRSGLKKGAEKPILPEPLEYIVRTGKRHGEQKELVTQKIIVSNGGSSEAIQQVVESIYAEQEQTILAFWDVAHDEKKDKYTLLLSKVKYTRFLEEAGFRLYKQGRGYIIVRIINNIVEEMSRAEVKDYIMGYLTELPFEFDNVFRSQLIDQVMKEHRVLFDEGLLEFLPLINDDFNRDERNTAYFYFQNGFVEVTKGGVELKPYNELHRPIWATQILARDFEHVDLEEQEGALDFDFYRFLSNLSNHDSHRLDALLTSLGYLLHGYKVRTHCYAIILCDEAIGNGPAGRTGKGIIIQALNHIRNTVKIDGRNFRIENQFAYQRVQADTHLIAFEDVNPKRLPFDRLFSILTEGLSVEKKQLGEIYIPFEDSPKIIISTNEAMVGEGGSYEGRMREIEVAPYYSSGFNPEEEFGRIMFDDWPASEWLLFDNLMIYCTQLYMAKGVVRQKPINLNRRKLIQKTSAEFTDFMETLEMGRAYGTTTLRHLFMEASGFEEKDVPTRKFMAWLRDWARYEGLELTEGRETSAPLPGMNRERTVTFTKAAKGGE